MPAPPTREAQTKMAEARTAASRQSQGGNTGRGTTGMQQGTNNYNSPANTASRNGTGTAASRQNQNTGKTGTGGALNVGRGGSGVGGGLGFGNDPARGGGGLLGMGGMRGSLTNLSGLLGMGGQRGSLTNPHITSLFAEAQRRRDSNILESQYSKYRSPNDFPNAGAEDLTNNAYMADQYSQYRSPPNVNAMAPQSRPLKDQSRLPQEMTPSPNYGEALQNALVEQQSSIRALNAARANPNYANLNPQGDRVGLSEAQFGSEKFAPGDIYRNPDRSASALRSVVNGINLTGGSPESKVDSMMKNMGYDNSLGRAAAIGRFGHETAGFDPKVLSGERMGDAGTAYGLAQWRGDRQTNAKAYADQMGIARPDIAGQAAFAGTEMANSYPKAYGQVQNAQTIADAMLGMNRYEGPRGQPKALKTGNPNLVSGYADSMNRAQQFASMSPPTQVASIEPASYETPPSDAPMGGLIANLDTAFAVKNALQGATLPNALGALNDAAGFVKQYAEAQPGIGITRSISQRIVAKEASKAISQAQQAIAGWQNGVLSQVAATEALQKAQKATTQVAESDPSMWQKTTPSQKANYSPGVQKAADNILEVMSYTPGGRAIKGIGKGIDYMSGGPAYRDAVSNGMPNDNRTDRMPSQGGNFNYQNDPRAGEERPSQNAGNGNTANPAVAAFQPSVNPMTAWMYPQYQSTWANLPQGQGGVYGRA